MSTIVKIIVGFLVLGALALIGVLVSIYLVNMGGARSNARDARITSDMSMLRSSFELVAAEEGGYSKLSCSYDSEIKAICGDIDSQCTQGNCAGDEAPGGSGDVTIHSSKEAYCAYTPLNEGEYYCIDSTGVETTASNPSATCNQGSFECSRSKEVSDYTTQPLCKEAGYYWYNETCHASEKEDNDQSDEKITAGWESYKDDDHDFKIKYPSNWEREVTKNKFSVRPPRKRYSLFKIQFTNKQYSIVLEQEQENFKEWKEQGEEAKVEGIEIDGYSGKRFSYASPVGFGEQKIILSRGEQTIIISESAISEPVLSTLEIDKN